MKVLGHDQMLAIREAVVSSRLADKRSALLTSISSELVASMPMSSTPSAQILMDLDTLNDVGILPDGTFPLGAWLNNAVALAAPRPEAEVFREALNSCPPANAAGSRFRPNVVHLVLLLIVVASGLVYALVIKGNLSRIWTQSPPSPTSTTSNAPPPTTTSSDTNDLTPTASTTSETSTTTSTPPRTDTAEPDPKKPQPRPKPTTTAPTTASTSATTASTTTSAVVMDPCAGVSWTPPDSAWPKACLEARKKTNSYIEWKMYNAGY